MEQLKDYNNNLKIINTQLESSIEKLSNQVNVQRDTNEDLKESIILVSVERYSKIMLLSLRITLKLEATEKIKNSQIQYLKVSMQQTIRESNMYVKALQRKIGN